MFCLEFSGLHYCLFVKVLFFLRSISFEEHLFCFSESLFSLSQAVLFVKNFFHFIFKLLSKPGCLSLTATVHYLSELSVCVKQFFIFLNFFLEIRVAFVRRNSPKVSQDCLSMSSTFCIFLFLHLSELNSLLLLIELRRNCRLKKCWRLPAAVIRYHSSLRYVTWTSKKVQKVLDIDKQSWYTLWLLRQSKATRISKKKFKKNKNCLTWTESSDKITNCCCEW